MAIVKNIMDNWVGYDGFHRFRDIRWAGVWHNIRYGHDMYNRGLLGFLNNYFTGENHGKKSRKES